MNQFSHPEEGGESAWGSPRASRAVKAWGSPEARDLSQFWGSPEALGLRESWGSPEASALRDFGFRFGGSAGFREFAAGGLGSPESGDVAWRAWPSSPGMCSRSSISAPQD